VIKNRKYLWIGFGIMVLIQLAVLGSMVFKQEKISKTGQTYKFELDAIDPVDPFRGKYITLAPKADRFHIPPNSIPANKMMHATFKVDERGYAQIRTLTAEPPRHQNYLSVTAEHIAVNKPELPSAVLYPFVRYYMNEHKALPAEKLTQKAARDPKMTCYAEVAISEGISRLLSVKINEQPIEQWIENQWAIQNQ